MRVGTEALLMLVAVGLYLFDSVSFLSADEAMIVRGGRKRWFAAFGASRWRLAGREPYLANPFTPHMPVFRLRLRFAAPIKPVSVVEQVAVPEEMSWLVPFVCLTAVQLFILLPIGLFLPVGTVFVLVVVAGMYASIIAALILAYTRRSPLRVDRRQIASVAFECLVCPPLSINLMRKLCAKMHVSEDLVSAATRLMEAEEVRRVDAECLRRIDEQLDYEEEGTARSLALREARARFVERSTKSEAL